MPVRVCGSRAEGRRWCWREVCVGEGVGGGVREGVGRGERVGGEDEVWGGRWEGRVWVGGVCMGGRCVHGREMCGWDGREVCQ